MRTFTHHRSPILRATGLAVVTATLLGAGVAGAATATSTDVTRVTVRYTPADLASDRGADALYARIVAAARVACGDNRLDIRDLNAVAAVHACEQRAVANAVTAVHNTRLATTYSTHLQHG